MSGRAATARCKAAAPCAICGKPASEAFAPFCSQRCADVDLGRWLGERYAIPGAEAEPEGHEDGPDRASPTGWRDDP